MVVEVAGGAVAPVAVIQIPAAPIIVPAGQTAPLTDPPVPPWALQMPFVSVFAPGGQNMLV